MRDLDTIHAKEAEAHRAHVDTCPALPRGPWGCGHFAPETPGTGEPADRASAGSIVPAPRTLADAMGPSDCGGILTLYVGADNRTGARIGALTVARILPTFGLSGWTAHEGTGVFLGTSEPATVLTILLPAPVAEDARALASRIGSAIARAHRQVSVAWSLAPALVGFADPRDASAR